MRSLIFFLFLMPPLILSAQGRDSLQSMSYSFDDDFFNYRGEGTDREYTAGNKIDFFYTKNTKRKFLDGLLMQLSGSSDNLYGWGIAQFIYTPNDEADTAIVRGDRPYAGILFLDHSLISLDEVKKQKITTEIDVGVIGKYSFARQTQNSVHQILHDKKAYGWNNQITTDVILNYYILFEKLIVQPSPNLEILGLLESNTGTWKNTFGIGFTFRAGLFNSYFSNYEKTGRGLSAPYKKFQFFFFMRPIFRAVMDNATLQGGFITHDNSPYTLTKDQITNAHMEFSYGFLISKNRLGFSFNEKLLTAEIKNGVNQQYGNLTFFIGL